HLVLVVTGPVRGGLRRTMQSICYGAGTMAIGSVPCVGFYLCWAAALWWVIAAIFMVREGQGVRAWRAALGALAFPALLVVTLMSVYVFVVAAAVARAQMSATVVGAGGTVQQVRALHTALHAVEAKTGALPAHGALLVTKGGLAPTDFDSDSSASSTL